jgi:hypothetical protein
MEEHRQEIRREDPPIDVDGVWTAVYNISPGGMCIVSLDPLQVGWERRFKLIDRRSGRTFSLVGEVMWTVPVSHELTRVGVQWVEVTPETRRWLTEQMKDSAEGGGKTFWTMPKEKAPAIQWL